MLSSAQDSKSLYEMGCKNHYAYNESKKNTCNEEYAKKALDYFNQAAELKHAEAQFMMGYLFEHYRRDTLKPYQASTLTPFKQATYFYEQAANQNHPEAMYKLGHAYLSDRGGIEKDYNKALDYFTKALELGYTAAFSSIDNLIDIMHENKQENAYLKAATLGSVTTTDKTAPRKQEIINNLNLLAKKKSRDFQKLNEKLKLVNKIFPLLDTEALKLHESKHELPKTALSLSSSVSLGTKKTEAKPAPKTKETSVATGGVFAKFRNVFSRKEPVVPPDPKRGLLN